MNGIPKYVASRTLEEPLEWNASLITGELAYELAKQGLADEIHFWVNPAVCGSGDRAFHGRQVRMRLIATTAFDSGVVLLSYRPIPNAQASATT